MKFLRFFVFVLLAPMQCWAITHVVNQAYFLSGKVDKTWNKKDPILVLGADEVDIYQIVRARKNYLKTTPIYWLLSDDQWKYNAISLNKDQKVLDFVNQLQEIYIQVLPENLCPRPAVFHEKTYEVIIIDSSWFLFQHQNELFKQRCPSVDVERFYGEIEESILNAKLKPIIMISHHSVSPKLFDEQGKELTSRLANQLQQSFNPMAAISNPAYQRFQEKMNAYMNSRPNMMFLSTNSKTFFKDSIMTMHHVALEEKKPQQVQLEANKKGVKVSGGELTEGIQLNFNQSYVNDNEACTQYTGPMYPFKLKGWFYEYFLGRNYRKLWNKNISISCFDLERERLTIDRVGGSLRSPDFQLKDTQGKLYMLRPLKKEVHIPRILRETLYEHVVQDLQSSIFPLGFLLSSTLSSQAGVLSERARLVYVDSDQNAFRAWREKRFPSGFYQFVEQPSNYLKDPELRRRGVLEVLSTKDMVNKLENESGYRMNQKNYLKERLFDILIGDWDRPRDQWQWVVVQKADGKVIEPFPIDRQGAFYRSDGVVSWWRRRQWVNYKLQDYSKRLLVPDPLMVETLSMDHRYTSQLTAQDWKDVVTDLQQRLSSESIDRAIAMLPITIPLEDQQMISMAFQQRLKDLPLIAGNMRNTLRDTVDIIGTPGKDSFSIQSGPGKIVTVTQVRDDRAVFTDTYDTTKTSEIRLYGLDGDDEYKLNWENYTKTKVRVIPGAGKDTVVARDQVRKPKIYLYDDNANVDSYYGFIPRNYNLSYSDFYSQVNQHKFNVLSPILFRASSNADSGFVIGGGVRYYKEGFQHAPWSSTNEIKANVVLNRNAANVMYQGVRFDVHRDWDFLLDMDGGLPRFYGSFFGLGNRQPDLNTTKVDEYYWMRAHLFELNTRMSMPIFQYVTLTPRFRFRFSDYQIGPNSFLNNPAENQLDTKLRAGTVASIDDANYYVGGGLGLSYVVDDAISGPVKKRIVRTEVRYMANRGLTGGDGFFQTIDANAGLTGFFVQSKTQWKVNGGYGRNFGNWEFFDAQFLGEGQNLRGFFTNRFSGNARAFGSFEINQSLLFRSTPIITDYGLGAFYDTGRTFFPNDISDKWHKSIGGQAYIVGLNSIAFRVGYAHAIFESQKGFWSFVLTTEL